MTRGNPKDKKMVDFIDSNGAAIKTDDLPLELLSELSCAPDPLESQIIAIIPADGSGITLDQILIALYRRHSILKKRRFLQNKLYRMSEVDGVADKKGVYVLHPALVSNHHGQAMAANLLDEAK
jgi:hypothetical protein